MQFTKFRRNPSLPARTVSG